MNYLLKYMLSARDILKGNQGQTLVEYGLLLILVAVVVIAGVTFVGEKANNTYTNVGNRLP